MKKIITITLVLTLTLGLMLTARAQDELYVYRHGGVTDTLKLSEVKGISHSRVDLQGRQHDDYVLMDVRLADGSVRQFPLEALDSVVMQRDGERYRLVRFTGGMSSNSGNGIRKALRRTSLEVFNVSASSVDGTEFFWEDGDKIYIDNGDGYPAADSVFIRDGKAVAEFFFKTHSVPENNVPVYYPGQETGSYNRVEVKTVQMQSAPSSSAHIGLSGDCGTAVATKSQDGKSYNFVLDHKASYLCFLPYIANDLGRTVLEKVTVRSDSAIAGTFTLTPERIIPKKDTTHVITLTTSGNFVLPRQASLENSAAYMVIAPQNGSTRLTCEFTVRDTVLQSTGVYTKTVDLDEVKPNMVYVVKANCNNYVVDLGLPVKFLNHNMGATSPEDYGGYYAFGELEDKGNYTRANYAYENTPYADMANIRLTDKDVAHVQLGGNFSLPTAADFNMLVDSCTWTSWTTINGNTGWLVTGKNGNTLFLPAASLFDGAGLCSGGDAPNQRGVYRTSQLVSSSALFEASKKCYWYLNLSSSSHAVLVSGQDAYLGESVRPVISAGLTMTDGTLVSVMTDSVQWSPSAPTTATLYGTVYGISKAKTAVELGFVAGAKPDVTIASTGAITATATAARATEPGATITTDGPFSVDFDMPKDTAYYIRAYAKDKDGNIEYGNALQFGRGEVDLGLPSGTKWANMNIGSRRPDEDGGYYAWGETQAKSSYTYGNHHWYENSTWIFPEHNLRNTQATRHDVASMNWRKLWMLPDNADVEELLANCTFTLSNMNGVKGYIVESTINHNTIFLPLAGWRNTNLNEYNNYSYIQSSQLRDSRNDYAWILGRTTWSDGWYRSDAIAARAVWKTNATAHDGTPMYVRTLSVRKSFDGTTEADTLRGVVRGVETVGSGTTYGFKYWKDDATVADTVFVEAVPDADGHIKAEVKTGLEPGTTYHYAAYVDNGTKKQCGETLDFTTVGVVDLGLSVKWANVNLGAESEGAGGDFYRWGATVPYRCVTQQSQSDEDITPQSGLDIATNLWGTTFRMPTKEEYEELIANTTRKWVTRNGYKGYMFVSTKEGYNDSIFIPVAGYYYDSYHNALDANADYWTSTANGSGSAYDLNFTSAGLVSGGVPSHEKYHGFSVRAVQERLAYLYTCDAIRNVKGAQEIDTLMAYVATASGNPVSVGFDYGTNSDMSGSQRVTVGTMANGYFKHALSGLQPGNTYYFRAFATDGTITRYGTVHRFGLIGAVDLDLPSGTMWATANLGALAPEDCGDYYAWGETEPKTHYTESTYKYGTTENIGSDYDIAGSKYDAAHIELGNAWFMPTKTQMEELISSNNCTWTRETRNGVSGYLVTSVRNNNTIFLPDAGVKIDDNPLGKGAGAAYLSSRHVGDGSILAWVLAWYPGNSSGEVAMRGGDDYWPFGNYGYTTRRYWGRVIRPVYKPSSVTPDGISLVVLTDSASWKMGDTVARLYGTFSTSRRIDNGYEAGFVIGDSSTIVRGRAMREYVETVSDGCQFTTTQSVAGNLGYWYRSFVTVDDTTYYGEAKHFGIEMVDMGLSVKWANVNVGAQTPEEYGDYFAWGETSPKTTYTSDNYAFGTTQNLGNDYDIAGSPMDAAAMNMGGGWRMPKYAEMKELLDNCDVAWVLQNGVKGYRFTSRKNGKTLFFPAAGSYFDNSSSPREIGNGGAYHTSTQYTDGSISAYAMAFRPGNSDGSPSIRQDNWYWPLGNYGSSTYRYWGRSVRAVFDPNVVTPTSDMMHVVADSAHWKLGDTSATLYATFHNVTPVDGGVTLGIVAGDSVTVTRNNGKYQTEKTVTGADHIQLNVSVTDNFGYWYKAYVVVGGQVYYSEPRHFGLELIDLGLPSRQLWANMNVGASWPEDSGDYYAWGEVDAKDTYTSENYQHGTSLLNEGNINGNVQYDAARKNMAGNYWRMPTRDEMQELISNCTWSWVLQNGVKGYRGVSNRNGKTIFLPSAGYRTDVDNPLEIGYGGSYMTANQMTASNRGDYIYAMAFRPGHSDGSPSIRQDDWYWPLGGYGTSTYRYYGRSIRAVGYRH